MSTIAGFRRRTVESAEAAARLYFEPLSILTNLIAPVKRRESGPLPRFRPLSIDSTSHWEKRLAHWRRLVAQSGSTADRRVLAEMALSWSADASRELEHLRSVGEADYKELMDQDQGHVSFADNKLAGRFSTGAWLLTAIEVGLVALFLSARFQFEALIAVGIGLFVTLILTTGAVATLSALILAGLENQPTRARQVLLPQIAVIGFSIFALGGAIFFARVNGSVSAKLLEYFLIFLVAMTPILVALLRSGARLFGWSNELTREKQRLAALKFEIDSLTADLKALVQDAPQESVPLGIRRRLTRLSDVINPDDNQTV